VSINTIQPKTPLVIAGKEYSLVYEFEAIAEAEEITGMALISGLTQKDVRTPKISLVRAMLFAGLHGRIPKITLAEASKLVNQHNWAQIWEKILEAWVECMKAPDEVEDPPQALS